MQSWIKTLLNGIRARLDGIDRNISSVWDGFRKIWDWIDGLAWVARTATIEHLPETSVHFEGTSDGSLVVALGANVNTNGCTAGNQYTVYFDGTPYQMYYNEYSADGVSVKWFASEADADIYTVIFNPPSGAFSLYFLDGWYAAIPTDSGTTYNEDHTFYIPPTKAAEEKLPNEFIDAQWLAKDVGDAIWFEDGFAADAYENGSVGVFINGINVNLVVGETYTFVVDGMKYTGVAANGYGSEIYFGNPIWTKLAGRDGTIEDNGDDYCVMTNISGSGAGWRLRSGTAGHTYTVEVYKGDNLEQLPMRYTPDGVAKSVGELRGTVGEQSKEIALLESSCFGWTTSASYYENHRTLRVNTLYPKNGFPKSTIYLAGYGYLYDLDEVEDYLTFTNPDRLWEIQPSNWREILRRPGETEVALTLAGSTAVATFSQKGGATIARVAGQSYNDQQSKIQINGLENSNPSGEEWIVIKHDLSKIVSLCEDITFTVLGNQVTRNYTVSVINGENAKTGVDVNCLIHLVWDDEAGTATAEIRAIDDASDDFSIHTVAASRTPLVSGETFSTALGKIAKWLSDLGTLAFEEKVNRSCLDDDLKNELESNTKLEKNNPTGTGALSLNRLENTTIGEDSVAVGGSNTASGAGALAEGNLTVASGVASHAEGFKTAASGKCSHTEGQSTTASGEEAHAEGFVTTASGDRSHAEGDNTKATGKGAHTEGLASKAKGEYSHAEGYSTIASGQYQHVQGKWNVEDAAGRYAHIVGNGTEVLSNAHTLDWDGNAWFAGSVYVGGDSQDNAAELDETVVKYMDGSFYTADGTAIDVNIGGGGSSGGDVVVDASLNSTSTNPVQNKAINAEIDKIRTVANTASNDAANASTAASTASAKADAAKTAADTAQTTADGAQTVANDAAAAASNAQSAASSAKTVANEAKTVAASAQEDASAALNRIATVSSTVNGKMDYSDPVCEGSFSLGRKADTTVGSGSFAAGNNVTASGSYSHAEGLYTTASGDYGSHAEGHLSTASGSRSHAEGYSTIAASENQHVQGKYNVEDSSGKYTHIVGGGTGTSDRKNIHTLDWSGNAYYTGTVECAGVVLTTPDGTKKYKITVDNDGIIKAIVTA